MAGPDQEKEYEAATAPVGGADITNNDEPLDIDIDTKDTQHGEIMTHGNASSNSRSESDEKENDIGRPLGTTKSYATAASAVTRTESNVDAPDEEKSWYQKLNPLRWGGIPPVPESRQPSREYNAPFLSLVYFQWMAPLMSVSVPTLLAIPYANTFRWATSDHYSRTTFGP
jgi:ATP-binding cassette subfamily C (CFTR/MRP) protein 1